ncbi:MAG: PilZ domain-containing protein [Bdellovibrionaceae bacterium]|nr:PilZ domain-containing protein [Pseudobdellovibrionaceae bacterium]
MQLYWLGSQTTNQQLVNVISKWNIQSIASEDGLKAILDSDVEKSRHFLMEINEVNEKKYLELRAFGERFGKKLKFIVFYQSLKASPQINKLHGSEVLLIGPEERLIANVLLKRFFQNATPLFRRWERFQLVTSGMLSLLSGAEKNLKISIVNFGAHGACIRFVGDQFKKKDFVILEYVSHDGKKIRMQSRIAWTQGEGEHVQAGVQFISREV